MTDDIAARMPRRGWSAVGGRLISRGGGTVRGSVVSAPLGSRGELKGHVPLASADGILGPERRLRSRGANWVRRALVWMLVVLLAPALVGWVWGLLSVARGG